MGHWNLAFPLLGVLLADGACCRDGGPVDAASLKIPDADPRKGLLQRIDQVLQRPAVVLSRRVDDGQMREFNAGGSGDERVKIGLPQGSAGLVELRLDGAEAGLATNFGDQIDAGVRRVLAVLSSPVPEPPDLPVAALLLGVLAEIDQRQIFEVAAFFVWGLCVLSK